MTEKSNVITVDFGHTSDLPHDNNSLQEKLKNVRTQYAEEVSDEALEAVLSICRNYGLLTRSDKLYMKDIVALSETIKSILLRYCNIDHPMQKIIDEAVKLEDEEDYIDFESDEEIKYEEVNDIN